MDRHVLLTSVSLAPDIKDAVSSCIFSIRQNYFLQGPVCGRSVHWGNTSDILSADELELYLSFPTGRAAWEEAA